MKITITDDKEKHKEVNEGYVEFALFFDFAEFCFNGSHAKALVRREVRENVVNNVINNNASKPEQAVITVPHKQTYEEYYNERKLAEGTHWWEY